MAIQPLTIGKLRKQQGELVCRALCPDGFEHEVVLTDQQPTLPFTLFNRGFVRISGKRVRGHVEIKTTLDRKHHVLVFTPDRCYVNHVYMPEDIGSYTISQKLQEEKYFPH